MQNAELQSRYDGSLNHVAVDETVSPVTDERRYLFTAVDSETNEIL